MSTAFIFCNCQTGTTARHNTQNGPKRCGTPSPFKSGAHEGHKSPRFYGNPPNRAPWALRLSSPPGARPERRSVTLETGPRPGALRNATKDKRAVALQSREPVPWLTLAGDLVTLAGDLVTLAGDLVTLAGDLVTLAGDLVTLAGDLVTLAGDLVTLAGDLVTLAGDLVTLAGDLVTLAGDLVTLAGDLVTLAGGPGGKDKVERAHHNRRPPWPAPLGLGSVKRMSCGTLGPRPRATPAEGGPLSLSPRPKGRAQPRAPQDV